MKPTISLLDCTLRDGGYHNGWHFGQEMMTEMVSALGRVGVEAIELGFLESDFPFKSGDSKFSSIEQAAGYVDAKADTQYYCMIRHGDYDARALPDYTGGAVSGIRYSFPPDVLEDALAQLNIISQKGYTISVQPCSIKYRSEDEISQLIDRLPEVGVAMFSIVDTLGNLQPDECRALFLQLDTRLPKDMMIGLHLHENLFCGYANVLAALGAGAKRNVMIDSCVAGLGRGGGNLRTTLMVILCNRDHGTRYTLLPLLELIEKRFSYYRQDTIFMLTAALECHPSYGVLMAQQKGRTLMDIYAALDKLPQGVRRKNCTQDSVEELFRYG